MDDHNTYIHSVIDKALHVSEHQLRGLQAPDFLVPEEMLDTSRKSPFDGIVFWKAIPADISEELFERYERLIGFKLPGVYKRFLSYKYFIDLNLGSEVEFFRHTPSFYNEYFENLSEGEVRETLYEGLIPFARNTDQGYFCFDTSNAHSDTEYKVVTFDSEYGKQEYGRVAGVFTFLDFIKEVEVNFERWKHEKNSSG